MSTVVGLCAELDRVLDPCAWRGAAKLREAMSLMQEMGAVITVLRAMEEEAAEPLHADQDLHDSIGRRVRAIAIRLIAFQIAVPAAPDRIDSTVSCGKTADEWRLLWLAWKNWADTYAPPGLGPSGPDSDGAQRSTLGRRLRGEEPITVRELRERPLHPDVAHLGGLRGIAVVKEARVPLTREQAEALAWKCREESTGECIPPSSPLRRRPVNAGPVYSWIIDAIIEASK